MSLYWLPLEDYILEGGPEKNGHIRYTHNGVTGVLFSKRHPRMQKFTFADERLARLFECGASTLGCVCSNARAHTKPRG